MSTNERAETAVADTLDRAGHGRPEIRLSSLAGGSSSDVRRVQWAHGEAVAKILPADAAERLRAEVDGLAAIAATGCVRTPAVIGLGQAEGLAILLLEWLPPAGPGPDAWRRFGSGLAAMHCATADAAVRGAAGAAVRGAAGAYGWPRDVWLGRTLLRAATAPTWPELLVHHRIAPLVRAAGDAGELDAADLRRLDAVCTRLERDLPPTPPASVLHGDLWSGNAHATVDDSVPGGVSVALIDPAVEIGDPWSELGMMELFGGFPRACIAAYEEAMGGRPVDADLRIAAGRLVHELNHLVLFGGMYRPGVLATATRILRG